MLKSFCCVLMGCLFSVILQSQKLSFSDLENLRTMKAEERDHFLQTRNFIKGEIKIQNDLHSELYRYYGAADGEINIKTIALVTSKKLPATLLQYSLFDTEEANVLQTWLLEHGFHQETASFQGMPQIFFRSKKHFLRYYEETKQLADGKVPIMYHFEIEY